jgi:hypothetical protein
VVIGEVLGRTGQLEDLAVIGLLYRADWTRLSLSAGVRTERDGDLALRRLRAMRPSGFRPGPVIRLQPDPGGPPIMEDVPEQEQGGYHTGHAALLIAPGRRYRLELSDDRVGSIEGSDGERGWTWWRMTGTAVRTAADVVRRTAGAVSATRSFLDELRGRNQPPAAG